MRGPFLTGGAGVLSLIAFFGLPQLTILGPESYTGSQVASEGLVCVLWLIPVIAGAGVLVSARSLLTHENYREGAGLLIAGGIIGVLVLAGESFFIELAEEGTFSSTQSLVSGFWLTLLSFGGGFWLTLLGMFGLAVGGYYLHADA